MKQYFLGLVQILVSHGQIGSLFTMIMINLCLLDLLKICVWNVLVYKVQNFFQCF